MKEKNVETEEDSHINSAKSGFEMVPLDEDGTEGVVVGAEDGSKNISV